MYFSSGSKNRVALPAASIAYTAPSGEVPAYTRPSGPTATACASSSSESKSTEPEVPSTLTIRPSLPVPR